MSNIQFPTASEEARQSYRSFAWPDDDSSISEARALGLYDVFCASAWLLDRLEEMGFDKKYGPRVQELHGKNSFGRDTWLAAERFARILIERAQPELFPLGVKDPQR